MKYVVYNPRGIELGVFDGADADEAIEACIRDAGYASKLDMEDTLGHPSELEARLIYDDDFELPGMWSRSDFLGGADD